MDPDASKMSMAEVSAASGAESCAKASGALASRRVLSFVAGLVMGTTLIKKEWLGYEKPSSKIDGANDKLQSLIK